MTLFLSGDEVQLLVNDNEVEANKSIDRNDENRERKEPGEKVTPLESSKKDVNSKDLLLSFQKLVAAMHNTLQQCDTKLNEVPKIIEKELSGIRSEMNEKLKDQGTSSSSNNQNSSLLTAGIRDDSPRDGATPILNNVKESIKVIVNKDAGIRREYKLTQNLNFDHFLDYLHSELRSYDLLYVIDSNVEMGTPRDCKALNEDKFKVRDILINRIDNTYHAKVVNIRDPVDLLTKIKDIKRSENSLTSADIKEKMYSMRFNPHRQRASDFWDAFDGLIRTHDAIPNIIPLPESEKRDAFYKAIVNAIPTVKQMDFMNQQMSGASLTYEQLKMYMIQNEANESLDKPASANYADVSKKAHIRCYNCHDNGHEAKECTQGTSGLTKCYNCKKFTGHNASECTDPPNHQTKYKSKHGNKGTNLKRRGFSRGRFHKRNWTERAQHNYGKRGKPHHRGRGWSHRGKPRGGNRGNHKSEEKREKGDITHYYLSSNNYIFKNDNISDITHVTNENQTNFTKNTLAKFLADSGASEHLTNSRLIFKTFNENKTGLIKCANKDSTADIRTEGVGDIEAKTLNGNIIELKNVICSGALQENLLSLRKFVDEGLSIYLDNKQIDIFDPKSNTTFLSGIYEKPYWSIEFQISEGDENVADLSRTENKIIAHLATRDDTNEHRYFTRSAAREQTQVKEIVNVQTSTQKNTEKDSAFNKTTYDRKVENSDCEDEDDSESDEAAVIFGTINKKFAEKFNAMLWHVRMGHASLAYLKQLQKLYPENKELQKAIFDETINECEVCLLSKIQRLPFKKTRTRASQPLQLIHADTMGKISPPTHPEGYKFISVFVDDYSRLAYAYPMRTKDETGYCLEAFVKSARNLLGRDAKVCYLRSDQGTELLGGYTIQVLASLGAELDTQCPDTPQHNGVTERFNQSIQKKIRAYMFDSRLPENMWDLALGAAVYIYNRTPHKSDNMQIPLTVFQPNFKTDMNQVKRFGCLAYMKIARKKGPKFSNPGRKGILVGYIDTGYVLLRPENGKLYESRNVRFNEKLVYGDRYNKDSIKNWNNNIEEIHKDTWFIQFENESTTTNSPTISKPEGETNRKRGRPRKVATSQEEKGPDDEPPEKRHRSDNTSTSTLRTTEDTDAGKSKDGSSTDSSNLCDEVIYALLAEINKDPSTYDEAMKSEEKDKWQAAINEELSSMHKNQVWKIVKRPFATSEDEEEPNIMDSRWVLKRKQEKDGKDRYRARLVIRGFKDKNWYDLAETYAPVSRLPLVRSVIAILNKYNLDVVQMDVKTAFLNGEISKEIYKEIPDGTKHTKTFKEHHVCKIERALYGLKISPKKWYERFAKEARKIGLESHDLEPCLFIWRIGNKILILLLYVDDMLIASNDLKKLREVIYKLQNIFEMTDLGEPKNFLGITLRRNREKGIISLTQETYINKILERFNMSKCYQKRTPMITRQTQNRERREREEDSDNMVYETPKFNTLYREAVGSLMYLANATRPDILYAVNVLSRHQINPTKEDWKMVERVFQYLNGTKTMGLVYSAQRDDLQSFSDASFADCKNSLTTSGFLIQLFGDTVHWKTQKQTYVALSTCEAEYVAMGHACKEMMSLNNSLKLILDTPFEPMKLWCDNKAAIACSKTSGGNKLRHMPEIFDNYVKQCAELKWIDVRWLASKDQIADIFTKPLSFEIHLKLMRQILNVNEI